MEKNYILLIAAPSAPAPVLEEHIICLKSLMSCYAMIDDYTENRYSHFQTLFGKELFRYKQLNVFANQPGGTEKFVKQAFIGSISSGKDVMPFLRKFVCVSRGEQSERIEKSYKSFKEQCATPSANRKDKIQITSEKAEEIQEVAEQWAEHLEKYKDNGLSLPYETADRILKKANEILRKKAVSPEAFSRVVVALGYFAICFLPLTETAYHKQLEENANKLEAVRESLSALLTSVENFLNASAPLMEPASVPVSEPIDAPAFRQMESNEPAPGKPNASEDSIGIALDDFILSLERSISRGKYSSGTISFRIIHFLDDNAEDLKGYYKTSLKKHFPNHNVNHLPKLQVALLLRFCLLEDLIGMQEFNSVKGILTNLQKDGFKPSKNETARTDAKEDYEPER